MLLYRLSMFLVGAIFVILSIAIYRGKTDLIHDYHRTKVTDNTAYGKAFGKAMLVISAALLLSGIISLLGSSDAVALTAVAVLIAGLAAGFVCIYLVQKKYNKGLF